MNEKKKKNPFLKIIAVLFLVYIVIYCLELSGYYENKMHLKTTYTNDKILQFEEDVKNGVEINLNRYVLEEDKDYSNALTRISDNIGEIVNKIMGGGIDEVGKIMKTLFG